MTRKVLRLRFVAANSAILLALSQAAFAGGPRYVAGVSYFNSGAKGTPLTWANGIVSYYTDQGDLSSQLPGPSADSFVADAFSRWTSTPTAAISASHAGQLGEDVSGANVFANGDGTITLPDDILPSAVSQPVAVVYDADGAVTDALVGQGASDSSLCFRNSVIGGPDNFSPDAHLAHALVILNGNCAQTSVQLPDLKYHLVRTLGRVLGLDWSQVNVNVLTGSPTPTTADYSGFPIMHSVDPTFCVPVSKCYPAGIDPAQPKLDDEAALSRLYPVTATNQSDFPGKQVLSASTVRIHGTVYFVDSSGLPAQPMEGVNVVARWVDPATGIPSRSYALASVSGFLFRGNAGNPVTGSSDPITGERYDRFGSDDPTMEGFFDLAGLPIPDGTGQAQFQLTVEAVDPVWSYGMGPYGLWPVQPSGNTRVFVNASLGDDVQQDILMQGSALAIPSWFGPTSYASPVPVPAAGDWMGTLTPYGDTDYFQFSAQANRTLSVSATALDESGNPSVGKAQPVVGMWALSTPQEDSATASTPALNTQITGETRLDAVINVGTDFRIGISDSRGDGRPDFRYHARVFYGDSVTPARASVLGGTPLAIQGLGFRNGDSVTVGSAITPPLVLSANALLVAAPGARDGVQDIALSDPATGAASTMTAVLTYGAGPKDTIQLISGVSQAAPVGGRAASPVVVEVAAPDGTTPVAGASVFFTSSPAASLAACGGASSCTVLTNQSGLASSYVTVLSPAVSTITAELAPASYNPPKEVQAIVVGTSSALDIALAPQSAWIAQGATLSVQLTARMLSNGQPVSGRAVDYRVLKGSALIGSSSTSVYPVTTDANGNAEATLQISSLSGDVQVTACVQNQPVDSPCLTFYGTAVPASALRVRPVSGNMQVTPVGQNFLPVTVQVTDSAVPAHPVLGVNVTFQSLVARAPQDSPIIWIGDTGISGHPMPVILASSQVSVQSDTDGLAASQPSSAGVQGPVIILGTAAAGNGSLQFALQSLPPIAGAAQAVGSAARSNLRVDSSAR
jgi:hypothetical protein